MMFKDLLGKTIEVYVEDMLVKSRMARDHVEHLRQMFFRQIPWLRGQPKRDRP